MDTMVGLNVTASQPTEEPSISDENLVESITRTESEHAKTRKLLNRGIASIVNWSTAEDQKTEINYRPQM